MPEYVLIKFVDMALTHPSLDEFLYGALRAADDTMAPITREYINDQMPKLEAAIAELKRVPTEDEIAEHNPYFCKECD